MVRPLISAKTITTLRGISLRTMGDTATIYSLSTTPDGEGGFDNSYVLQGIEPCNSSSRVGKELLLAGRVSAEADTVLNLPALTHVEGSYHFVVTDHETGAIQHLEAKHVVKGTNTALQQVFCQDLTA